jgi:glucokinase
MAKPALVADIGASTIRIALARGKGALGSMRSFPLRSDENPETRLAAALAAAKPRPEAAVLAVAAPVDADQVTMTNFNWSFSQRTLMRSLKLKRMLVVNDFVAVAHSLPALRPADIVSVPGGHKNAKGNLLACGPGSGFGVSALIPARRPIAIASEAGHMRLGAATADAARVVAHLVQEMGTVVTENVLSGPGLARLHRILTDRHESAAGIAAAARKGRADAKATVEMFLGWFGRVAGDLALAFDARGGVYLAGGVSRALAPLVSNSGFREAFENHPPYATRLAAIPVNVVVHPAPGLAGAAVLAERLVR